MNELGKSSGQAGQQAGQAWGKAADGFNAAGKMMAVGGAAMLAPMVDAVRGAANLQQAMDQVGVAFNATDDQAAALQDTILDVASSTIFGAQDVADAAMIMGKAGVSVEDATGGMIQATADFAAATDTNLPMASEIMTRTASQWGISGKDMIDVADDLTTIFNETSLGADDWLGGMANFAPIMRLAGSSLEDTGAALGYFKDQGLSAREAGTSLSRAMDAMISPTTTQAAAMADLGIATEDFFRIGEDGQREFIGWADTFDMLNDKMQGYDDVSKAAFLTQMFGKEAFDAMGLGMLGNTDKLRDLNQAMKDNTGIARKQSDALTDNLLGSLEKLGGSYDKLRVKMGDPFLDPLQEGVDGVTKLVDALADAPPEVQNFAGQLLGLGGGLLSFGGLAALGTGQVLKLGQQFAQAGLSLPKFAAGLGLVGLAIGAGLLAYDTNFMGFRDTVDGAMKDAGKAVETFGRTFDEAFFENRNAEMGQLAAGIAAVGTALDAALGTDITPFTRKLAKGIDVLTDSFEAGAKAGIDPWVNALESAAKAARAMGNEDIAQGLHQLSGAWDAMQRSMTETEGTMPQLNRELSALQAGLDTLIGDDLEGALGVRVPEFFDNLGSEASRTQQDIQGFIADLGKLKDAVGAGDWGTIWDDLTEGISGPDGLGAALQSASDQVMNWFDDVGRMFTPKEMPAGLGGAGFGDTSMIDQLADSVVTGFDSLGTTVQGKLESAGNPFEPVQQWLQDSMDEVGRFFQPQEIPAGLGGAGMGDTSGISQWFSGMVDGIGAGMDQAVADLGALAEEKKTGFKNALGDFFGPIGQFLFPSEDAQAAGEMALGDPATLGKQFGDSLLKTFTDPAFAEGLNQSIDQMPEEAFQTTGAALLGAINSGMETALTQPIKTDGQGADAAGKTMGQQMVQTLATGLTEGFLTVPPETFIPAATGMMGQINNALGVAMADADSQFVDPSQQGSLPVKGGGLGMQMAQQLATGLATGITESPVETFLPATTALGTKLGEAMTAIQDGTAAPTGLSESTQMSQGFGTSMVQGMATGLANGITTADPAMFVPVTNALGTQLGAAMSMAAQQTQPPGGVGPAGPAPTDLGTSMVQGLATGLTDSITAAPPETFYPVANALGSQLGTALQTAMTQTVGVGENTSGGMVGEAAAGGIGADMVTGLATGLGESITNAPVETFAPVGAALGTKMGEALQMAVESGAQGAAGGTGGDSAGVGAQLGESVSQMLQTSVDQADFAPVGTSLSTKMSEALQTSVTEGAGGDVGAQLGQSISDMLNSAIEGADFSGVGEAVGEKLTEALTQAIDDASSQIEEAMSGITDAITEAVDQMGEAIGEATEGVSQAVEDMSASIEDATSAVSDAVSEMQSAVEEAVSGMEEAASGAVEAMEPIASAAEEAASAVASAMDSMAASVEGAVGKITAAAGQIVAALNQIASAAGAIGGAAGNALSSGFSGAVQEGSPSKVFIRHGQMITAGLAVGMAQGQGIPKAAKTLAGLSMTAVGDAIGMGSPAKKFFPHGAAITDGLFKGMLDQAKGRMQSAMGQMAGAVESGMGKVKSAMSSAMERVRSQGQQEAASAGSAAGTAAAEGLGSEDKAAEKAARRLWRRAYKELMDGVGAARFLGTEWAREFWEGMLDDSGTLAFAQYVTQQIVGAAEDAVTAAAGKVRGLATQLAIVADTIGTLQGDIASLESEDAALSAQAQQAKLSDLQQELSLQRAITQELEGRLKTEVSEAHQAHILAAQTRSVAAQADYEDKLRTAQATETARSESAIRETALAATLDAMQQALQQATRDELATRRAAIAEELALKKAQLAQEQALQDDLEASQHAAQLDYTHAVIDGSNDRIRQLQKELRGANGMDRKAQIKAEIALERQKLDTANQLAAALAAQASAANPEALAQANAQVQFLTEQLGALGDVDAGGLLEEIASKLGAAASSLSTAAADMSTAATELGSTDASAGMSATASSAGTLAQQIEEATGGMYSMKTAYENVTKQMVADQQAFNDQFAAMVAKQRGTAEEGAEAIGTALTTGITDRIAQGGPAMQQSMLQTLQTGMDAAEGEAGTGATNIADTFGAAMRGQLGVQLPKVHQDILTGMNRAIDATAQEAKDGGKQVMTDFGTAALSKLDQDSKGISKQMAQPFSDGINDARKIAAQGGKDIGGDLATGVQQGVQGQATNIANTAAQTVRDAIQAARDAAKAKSPSRRMMELGDDMGMGLVLGLDGRRGDAEDASARLVHIPMSPTSSGGVSGRRAYEERGGGNTTYHIENLNLPDVTDPREFITILNQWASSNGVAAGRG